MVQNAVSEANRKIVDENNLKLAHEPKIQFPEDRAAVEQAMEAKGDLAFTVELEVLPIFELADISDVSVRRAVATVGDADIEESLTRMAKQNRTFETKEGPAAEGDRVVVDFNHPLAGLPVRFTVRVVGVL